MRHACEHPTDLGAVGEHIGAPDAAETEGAQGAAVLGLGAGGSVSIIPLPFGNDRPPAKGNALTNR